MELLKKFSRSVSKSLESDVEKDRSDPLSFKKQFTVSIIAYLTLQNFLITSMVGGLATGFFYNYSLSANQQSTEHGLETIHNFTMLQQGFACEEVHDHIHIFLSEPVLSLENTAHLYVNGLMELEDWSHVHRWFFYQIQEHTMVTSMSFVEFPSNDVFGVSSYNDGESRKFIMLISNSKNNRLCPTEVSVGGFCPVTGGNMTLYPFASSDTFDLSEVTTKIATPMFGPPLTELGEYAMSKATRNEVSWFPTIRISNVEEGLLGLYFVFPLWTEDETFLGSFVGEMDLTITHELLHHLQEDSTENTVIYIFQRDESMVGSSTEESIVAYDPELKIATTLKVSDMTDPFINLTQSYFRSEFNGSFSDVPPDSTLNAEIVDPSTGINYLVQFNTLAPGTNLEWMVVVGAPQEDYTGTMVGVQNSLYKELQINNRNVVIMIFTIQFALVLVAMTLIWFRVVKPLRTLVSGMNKAKDFDFTAIANNGTFATNPSGLSEVYECEKAFFDMTAKFAHAFKQNRNLAQLQRQGTAATFGRSKDQII